MEILEKIAAYLSGNHSQRDEQEILEWRKNPENDKVFHELHDLWKNSAELNRNHVKVDIDQAWRKMEIRIKEVGNDKKIISLRYVWMAAAVIVPLIIGVWMMNYFNEEKIINSPQPFAKNITVKAPEIKMIEVVTADSVKLVYLPDSTAVSINVNSVFRYPEKFTGNERGVFLEGEAFFTVTKNQEMPFIIRTETSLTKVVGTAFNLKAYKEHDDVELHVESGTVEFSSLSSPGEDKLILQANDKGTLNKKSKKVVKSKHTGPKIKWDTSKLKRTLKKLTKKIKKNKIR